MTTSYAIYILESLTGYFKIGISKHPKKKVRELNQTSGYLDRFSLVYWWYVGNRREARAIEQGLHNAFKEKNVRGEWFDLNSQDLISLESNIDLLRYEHIEERAKPISLRAYEDGIGDKDVSRYLPEGYEI